MTTKGLDTIDFEDLAELIVDILSFARIVKGVKDKDVFTDQVIKEFYAETENKVSNFVSRFA